MLYDSYVEEVLHNIRTSPIVDETLDESLCAVPEPNRIKLSEVLAYFCVDGNSLGTHANYTKSFAVHSGKKASLLD